MEWGPISIGVPVALSIVAIILTRRLVRRKQPAWAYTQKKIIGLGTDAPKELQLNFNGKPINDVYRTTFIFFNRGRETIRSGDVTQPVTMHFQEGEILREPIITITSNEAIKFLAKHVITQGGHQVRLEFLYLDHEDGGVFEVLHTQSTKIMCSGNVIGSKKIDNIGELSLLTGFSLGFWIASLVMISVGVPFMIHGLPPVTSSDEITYVSLSFPLGAGLLFVGAITFVSETVKRWRSAKYPSWCKVYLEKTK